MGKEIRGVMVQMKDVTTRADKKDITDRITLTATTVKTGKLTLKTIIDKEIRAMMVQMTDITTRTGKEDITDRITVPDTILKIGKIALKTMIDKIIEASMRQEAEGDLHGAKIIMERASHTLEEGDKWIIICRLRIFKNSSTHITQDMLTSIKREEKG